MPATYLIRDGLVVLLLEGEYKPDDIRSCVATALEDPELPEDARVLMDVTRSTALERRSPADVRSIAGYLARLSPRFGSRIGIAAGSEVHYGLMRMAEVYSETGGMTARVFRSVDEAAAWLATDTALPRS